jgi:hypothetical protein
MKTDSLLCCAAACTSHVVCLHGLVFMMIDSWKLMNADGSEAMVLLQKRFYDPFGYT